jgi:hypothetical protein
MCRRVRVTRHGIRDARLRLDELPLVAMVSATVQVMKEKIFPPPRIDRIVEVRGYGVGMGVSRGFGGSMQGLMIVKSSRRVRARNG